MSDATIRLAVTIGLLGLFVGLEHLVPARANVLDLRRFSRHVGMTLLSSAVARLALAGGLAGIATFARDQGVGLFNVLALPIWIAIGISFLVLDLGATFDNAQGANLVAPAPCASQGHCYGRVYCFALSSR